MHWRRWTWALIAWTALMLAWVLAAARATAAGCSAGDCGVYTLIAVILVGAVWLAGAVPLSILWYTRGRRIPSREARWGDGSDIEPR